MDDIKQVIEILENALYGAEDNPDQKPEYLKISTEEEVKKFSPKQVDEILKHRTCKIDAYTVGRIIEMLQDAEFQKQLADAGMKRAAFINTIGVEVEHAKDKDKAYRRAAKEIGWTDGKTRTCDTDLLDEYLHLIGRVYLARLIPDMPEFIKAPAPEPMKKEDAIQLLTEKYNINSSEATYKRLQRAVKSEKKLLKSENKNFSHLIGILPTYMNISD